MTRLEVEGRELIIKKPVWSPEETEIALCLGVEPSGPTTRVDINKMSREGMMALLKNCAADLVEDPFYSGYMNGVYSMLKQAYTDIYNEFNTNYYPRLGYKRELYKHQKMALATMMYRKDNFLSFDMGLGKTITSASLSKMFSVKRTLILSPALVKWNWFRDMSEDWGYNPAYWSILDAVKSKTMLAFMERFVVVNYETANKWMNHITSSEVGHIIIDEAHYIKNHKTGRYKVAEKVYNEFPNARVTLLSGTPVTNRSNDLFSYLKLTNHYLGKNHSYFMKRFVIVQKGSRGTKAVGSKNIDGLRDCISNFMIRKRTEECLDMPDLVIRKYHLPFDRLASEYDEAMKKLVHAKDHYDSADEKGKREMTMAVRQNIHSLNRIVATMKVKDCIELIEQIHETGDKVIVFCSYTDPLERIQKHFKDKCVLINGKVAPHDRDKYIQKFKNDSECMTFLGNVKAAGVGINLVNANHVIFLNMPFTPDDLEQPYKRAHRIGQKNKVRVYFTIADGSIDEHIYNLVTDKNGDINMLVDGGAERPGVVDLSSIPSRLFDNLVREYKHAHGEPVPEEESRFIKL